tara:strand:+ start:802 stop:1227 length:426 start_codon:yes stop_codon:yes gene_type:complete
VIFTEEMRQLGDRVVQYAFISCVLAYFPIEFAKNINPGNTKIDNENIGILLIICVIFSFYYLFSLVLCFRSNIINERAKVSIGTDQMHESHQSESATELPKLAANEYVKNLRAQIRVLRIRSLVPALAFLLTVVNVAMFYL